MSYCSIYCCTLLLVRLSLLCWYTNSCERNQKPEVTLIKIFKSLDLLLKFCNSYNRNDGLSHARRGERKISP